MERSAALRDLFDRSSPYIGDRKNFAVLAALRAHPFHAAFASVSDAAAAAVRATRAGIAAVLVALEDCSPAVADLESALLLREAELLSASGSVKDLLAGLREGRAQMERRESGGGGWWGALRSDADAKAGSRAAMSKPSLQLLEHLEAGLDALEASIGRWRLKLALCKEELALYKQEMYVFGRANVLSCTDPIGHDESPTNSPTRKTVIRGEVGTCATQNNLENSGSDGNDRRISSHGGGSARHESDDAPQRPRFAIAAVSLQTRRVMNRAFQKAAHKVTSVPLYGGTRMWSIISGRDNDTAQSTAKGLSALAARAPVAQFVYTPEEEQRLTAENLLLQGQQQEATAQDAKSVEASVRELTQLTSLMSERVVQQNEQFSILLKNTGEAQNNMSKAVGQVNLSLSHFWNSTRQLIACLWFSILLLLAANWLIR